MNGTETRRPWYVTVELSEPRDFNGETRVFTKDHEDAIKKQLSALRPAPEIKVVNDRVTLRLRVDGATELEAWNVAKDAAEKVLTGSIAEVTMYTLVAKLTTA